MKKLAVFLLAVLLAGCAGTPYQHLWVGGGYSETNLGAGKWAVTFLSNVASPRGYAAEAALYRSAELANSQGFKHFKVITSDVAITQHTVATATSVSCCVSAGETAHLTIVGMATADAQVPCEQASNANCLMFETQKVLEEYGPSVHAKTLRNGLPLTR